jgi:hypothetical protein
VNSAQRWLAQAGGVGTTLSDALAQFDAMPAVTCEDMIGHWRGRGLPTGHFMDGLLESYAWHGKSFVSADDVHPLVFLRDGVRVAVDPWRIPLRLARWPAVSRNAFACWLFRVGLPLLTTRQPRARLRAMTIRGGVTATMVYDHLPIMDSFRRIDERTLLGLMDMRGAPPFFFVLEFERAVDAVAGEA